VYIAGILAIKYIATGARAEIFEVKTGVSGAVLRTILANSITLVPGSVTLDLSDDRITLLWLTNDAADSGHIRDAEILVNGKLEKMLKKVQS
jgi:multisubunit Na+/H+ antiporter MnhE subunit